MVSLAPSQQRALDALLDVVPRSPLTVLHVEGGRGRSTIVEVLHASLGGALLRARDLMEALQHEHPWSIEETFHRIVFRALERDDVLIIDDMDTIASMLTGQCGPYPRPMFVLVSFAALRAYAEQSGKRVVFAAGPHSFFGDGRAHAHVTLEDFTAEDYAAICAAHLGPAHGNRIDFGRVYRFAPRLTATQLRSACEALRGQEHLDTEIFLEHLRARQLASNVDLAEVQQVELHDLKGMDDVIRALEANVLLPLEQPELAAELGLKPKRGILLAGPPGTGKTTIGRALAHRIRSKFFLLDGTVIAGTSAFYHQVTRIFDAAAENAPSIIFIDDSDVIFESGTEVGLYRYLLTKLDGLESKTPGQVCLVLTAMDVGGIPPALVRSGRIELWLETRLPDEDARAQIVDELRADLPGPLASLDPRALATASEGLSGADLRRVIEDGKLLFAYDRANRAPLRPVMEYFLDAVASVRQNKQRYAEAEARARTARPQRPPYFDAAMSFGWMGVMPDMDIESQVPP
jgi:ATP-dependent 26S proteasome regulatory subunit